MAGGGARGPGPRSARETTGAEDGCLDENKRAGLITRSVGRRKDKRAGYVSATSLIVVSRLDQSPFCYPPPDLYDTVKPWLPPICLPLSPPAVLRMHLNSLILSLVLTWASLRSTHAMPTSRVVVELSACGMTPESSNTLLSQQVCISQISLHLHRSF